MSPARYQVHLHAVAPDGTDAGGKYPDATLETVSEEQLRKLLTAFADLSARLPPLISPRPEIRIRFPAGLAMIAPLEGKLFYVSWDIKGRGIKVSVDDIMSIVAATAEGQQPARTDSRAAASGRKAGTRSRKFVTLTLLGVAIAAINGATVWMLLRPPRTILPPFTYLPDA